MAGVQLGDIVFDDFAQKLDKDNDASIIHMGTTIISNVTQTWPTHMGIPLRVYIHM